MTILLSIALGLIAAIHAAWGLGVWVPIRDEAQLARAVVGAKGVERMPGPIPCLLVAGAMIVLIAALWMPQVRVARAMLWLAMVVFVLRGALAYVPFWRKMTPEEPFNSNDQRYYGPLCLLIGCGLGVHLAGV